MHALCMSAWVLVSHCICVSPLQDSISALRSRLNSSQKESEGAARGLRAAREEVTLQARQLKAQLSRARAAERNQLTNLTVHSNAAAKNLQGIITKVLTLMHVATYSIYV